MNTDRTEDAYADLKEAQDDLRKALKAVFPVSARVSWPHGQHRHHGTVIGHGGFGNPTVTVEYDTGHRRRLTPYDLIQ